MTERPFNLARCERHPEAHLHVCYCGRLATVHIAYGSGCGNVCDRHATSIKRRKRGAKTSEPVALKPPSDAR
jgi:hypothetical protein